MAKPAAAIEEAACWYACLRAEDATEQDRQNWQHWLDADPANRLAWARIQEIRNLFDKVPGKYASPVLTPKTSRRAVLRGMAVALCAGLAGAEGWRQLSAPEWRADLRTGPGERRREILADGTCLYLNARSAVDVLFDSDERQVLLRAGEILVETQPDKLAAAARPFIVGTPHGRVRALGTRFVVRLHDTHSTVQVLEHAVEIRPALSSAPPVLLHAGQEIVFDSHSAGLPQPQPVEAGAWRDGRLNAMNMPLPDFIAELARYRRGHLGYTRELAHLRISGVFPLDDTDTALAMLAETFPVQVTYRTRYWTSVQPREAKTSAAR